MQKILISRVDQIGDVILTLPICGVIKEKNPEVKIFFLCQASIVPILERCPHIDEIVVWPPENKKLPKVDAVIHVLPKKSISRQAKKDKIKLRIGTNRRWFHWLYCNRLVNLTRKNSDLHESELNMKLLAPLNIKTELSVHEFWHYYGWTTNHTNKRKKPYLDSNDNHKFRIIFHIKSRGSAKEWSVSNFLSLAEKLPKDQFQIYLTGTRQEGDLIRKEETGFTKLNHVFDVTGKFSLSEFIDFIESIDGLIAASTGPLHIASALGIYALGLFPAQKPIHAGRWRPIGEKADFLSEKKHTNDQYLNIPVSEVMNKIQSFFKFSV